MLEAEIWGIAKSGEGSLVFLRPLGSDYSVPIFIGQLEAQSILIGYGGTGLPRPLTADLLLNVARSAGLVLLRAEVNEIRDNTFFARLFFVSSGETAAYTAEKPLVVDARPSDAFALAVRSKCPLYVAEGVVEQAGILTREVENGGESETPAERRETLKVRLDNAVALEDYEKAAEIRDMLLLLEQEEKDLPHT
ncbi:MAG: bifunctional nuclease family protein [Treponema sp.]|jgi:bifunctional DNase/RNase|nr:bifunctional nuclease family protein [Treponema sp.]